MKGAFRAYIDYNRKRWCPSTVLVTWGKKLTSIEGLSLSGPSLCTRYCNMKDNILKQMTLYGEAKPHKDNYYLDAFFELPVTNCLKIQPNCILNVNVWYKLGVYYSVGCNYCNFFSGILLTNFNFFKRLLILNLLMLQIFFIWNFVKTDIPKYNEPIAGNGHEWSAPQSSYS